MGGENEEKTYDRNVWDSGSNRIEYSNNTSIDTDYNSTTTCPASVSLVPTEEKSISIEPTEDNDEAKGSDLSQSIKMKIWENVGYALKKCPRKDKESNRTGIILDDVISAGLDARRAEELLRATGWESSEAEASGLKIWWAPEKVLRAYGLA